MGIFTALAIGGIALGAVGKIFGGRSRRRTAFRNAQAIREDAIATRETFNQRATLLRMDADDILEIAQANKNLTIKDALEVNRIAEFNANVLDDDARALIESAEVNREQRKVADKRIISSAISKFSASGVSLAGSPLAVLRESMRNMEGRRIRGGSD